MALVRFSLLGSDLGVGLPEWYSGLVCLDGIQVLVVGLDGIQVWFAWMESKCG